MLFPVPTIPGMPALKNPWQTAKTVPALPAAKRRKSTLIFKMPIEEQEEKHPGRYSITPPPDHVDHVR